jgi:hypothetical protein
MEPVGWLNTALPLAALAGLAVALPEVLAPRGNLSHGRLAAAVAASAALTLAAGALLFAALYAAAGADPGGALAAAPAATAGFFLTRSAAAALLWLPLLGLVWLIKAQAVERRRGEAAARQGRPEGRRTTP